MGQEVRGVNTPFTEGAGAVAAPAGYNYERSSGYIITTMQTLGCIKTAAAARVTTARTRRGTTGMRAQGSTQSWLATAPEAVMMQFVHI